MGLNIRSNRDGSFGSENVETYTLKVMELWWFWSFKKLLTETEIDQSALLSDNEHILSEPLLIVSIIVLLTFMQEILSYLP